MGHNRYIRLPSSRSWAEVVGLLRTGAAPSEVIARAADAAQRSFTHAVDDPVYAEAIRLLVVISNAGRSGDFAPGLARDGLPSRPAPTLMDLLESIGNRLDRVANESTDTSDIGELARRALLGTLYSKLDEQLPGLFEETEGDLEAAVRQFSTPAGFSELSRAFYTRMTAETLAYWLDRTLSAQIGHERSFEDVSERNAFNDALDQFSAEATRIIKEFSAGWYAKNVLGTGTPPDAAIRSYAAIAFKKINDELRRKVGTDA